MGDLENLALPGLFQCNYLLAADVSTLGGIERPGFKKPVPFVGFCLKSSRSKMLAESGGGEAVKALLACIPGFFPDTTHAHDSRALCIHALPSEIIPRPQHTWSILLSAGSSTCYQRPPSCRDLSKLQPLLGAKSSCCHDIGCSWMPKRYTAVSSLSRPALSHRLLASFFFWFVCRF